MKIHHRMWVVAAMLASAPALAVQQYTVTDLGLLPGGHFLSAYAINDAGMVAGYGYSTEGNRAFSWANGQLQNLGAPSPGDFSGAYDINNAGVAVGSSGGEAVQWSPGQAPTVLSRLPGASYANANAINNQGTVVGSSGGVATSWKDGQVSALTSTESTAIDINDAGLVVGAINANYQRHAATWKDGIQTMLQTPTGYSSSIGLGVNEQNVIVGRVTSANIDQAAIWTDGQVQVLAPVAGDAGSMAYDINEKGQIVGLSISLTQGYSFRAALWEGGKAYDLASLVMDGQGWLFSQAQSINESGQIVGWGNFNGQGRSFLLSPVPEVGSAAMMLWGFFAAGLYRFTKSRTARG